MVNWFHILKDGKTVQTGIVGNSGAVKALKARGVLRVNIKNLRKKISKVFDDYARDEHELEFKKEVKLGNGYTIIEIDDSHRRTIDPKLRKTKITVSLNTSKEKDTNHTYRVTKIIDLDNYQGLIKKVNDEMKALPESNTCYFSIIIHLKTDSNITKCSTVYGNYNNTLDDLYIKLKRLLHTYDQTFLITGYTIKQIFKKAIGQSVIFGGMSPQDLINELNFRVLEGKYPGMKQFFTDHKLLPIKTYKNCLISTCMMYNKRNETDLKAYHKDLFKEHKFIYDVKEIWYAVKNFKLKYGLKRNYTEPDDLFPMLSEHLKLSITLKDIDNDLAVYNTHDYTDSITIFSYGGHAFPCIPLEDLEIDDKDLYKYVIRHDNHQRKIKIKTRDSGPSEVDPENFEHVKESDFEKYHIATYDLETCDGSKIDGKTNKHNTICYASGYTQYVDNVKKTYDFWLCDGYNPIKEMLKVIYDKDNHDDQIIYAHNGGKFDAWVIFKELCNYEGIYIQNLLIQNGRISNLVTKGLGKTIIFRDSLSLMPASLDQLCKDFQPSTVKLTDLVNHNTVYFERVQNTEIKDYAREYLINDCVCLLEILELFNTVCKKYYNIDIRQVITSAGIARKYYFNEHYVIRDDRPDIYKGNESHKNEFIHEIPRVEDMKIRPWYFGGRNEIFNKMGVIDGPIYYYDFTSLYPYIMKKYDFPYGKYKKSKIYEWTSDLFGIIKVAVKHVSKTKRPLHGLIHNGKLTFPHINEWTIMYLSSEEIRYSLKHDLGYDYQFMEIYQYDLKGKLFESVIDSCYKLKIDAQENNNPALRAVAKIIINSMYGFWGLNKLKPQFTVKKDLNDLKKTYTEDAYTSRGVFKESKHIGKYSFYETEEMIKSPCNVNIALMITAYSRVELYDLMKDIDDKGGSVYYCDTDSVITNLCLENDDDLYKKYIRTGGKALGELTNETGLKGGFYNKFVSLGLKQYALYSDDVNIKAILKFKGFNAKMTYMNKETVKKDDVKTIVLSQPDRHLGTKKLVFNDFVEMAKGVKLQVDTMTFLSSPKDVIFNGKGVVKLENSKVLQMNYNKGVVHENNTVTAIEVN